MELDFFTRFRIVRNSFHFFIIVRTEEAWTQAVTAGHKKDDRKVLPHKELRSVAYETPEVRVRVSLSSKNPKTRRRSLKF